MYTVYFYLDLGTHFPTSLRFSFLLLLKAPQVSPVSADHVQMGMGHSMEEWVNYQWSKNYN